MGEEPVNKTLLSRKATQAKIIRAIKSKIFKSEDLSNNDELLEHMKKEFQQLQSNKLKVQFLTMLPLSWTPFYAGKLFACKSELVTKAQNIRRLRGVLSVPEQRVGTKRISEEATKVVKEFYLSEKVSRTMPGKDDVIVVREKGKEKEKRQKQLLMMNLSECYALFKSSNPGMKVSSISLPKEAIRRFLF